MEEFVIYTMSTNAKTALEQGEKLYHQWKKDEIIKRIGEIRAENDIVPEFSTEQFKDISERVLKKYMLSISSWHHVNRECTWFYVVNKMLACDLSKTDISRMRQWTRDEREKENKPKLANVKLTEWVEKQGRQFTKKQFREAVVYNGNAYFKDGSRAEIRDGSCVIVKECKSIVKEKRNIFEGIVRVMRLNYGIAI